LREKIEAGVIRVTDESRAWRYLWGMR
jgi:hypothetical protein